MSSINLAKKIADKKKGTTETLEKTSLKEKIQSLSSEGNAFSQREKTLLLLSVLGIASLFGIRWYVTEQYIPEQMLSVEQQSQALDTELQQLTEKLASFDNVKKEIDAFELRLTELKTQITLIESVQKSRNSVVRMVDKIIQEMPEAVWLDKLNIEVSPKKIGAPAQSTSNPAPNAPTANAPDPNPTPSASESIAGNITLNGFAKNMQLVSAYMDNLQGTVFFPNWRLVETTESSAASPAPGATNLGADAKRFELQAQVVNP